MEPSYEYLDGYSHRYIRHAQAFMRAGEHARAEAYGAMGSAFQLFPPRAEKPAKRGEFFGPMMSGGFGEVPDMAFVRRKETIDFLSSRLPRLRHGLRRARVADAVWEFSETPDATAARIAADEYLEVGHRQLKSTEEFAAMSGAGAIVRSLHLARAIGDKARVDQTVAVIIDGVRYLGAGERLEDHVPLFRMIEALLTLPDRTLDFGPADEALTEHRTRLEALDEDNFHFVQGIIEIEIQLARRRGDTGGISRLRRELGESIAKEAAWKGRHYQNGGLVAMTFYAKAAAIFEQLGDRKRAEELHVLERAAFGGATFHELRAEVTISAEPFRNWLANVLTSEEHKVAMWPAVPVAILLPTVEQIETQRMKADTDSPILALIGVSTVQPEGVLESVPAQEASRRRAAQFAYEQHGLNVALLVKLAKEVHAVSPIDALPVFRSTDFIDATSDALVERVLKALTGDDWLTAGYLAGSLIERLVRARVTKTGGDVMYTDRGGPTPRRLRRPLEQLLDRLPLSANQRAYVRWVVAHPGLNLRNDAGHGLLEKSRCHEVLGAHILYTLLILAFGDLNLVEHDDAPTA